MNHPQLESRVVKSLNVEKQSKFNEMDAICRIVTRSDAKLPTTQSMLPSSLFQPPSILDKLDLLYNAQAHDRTRNLRYMEQSSKSRGNKNDEEDRCDDRNEESRIVAEVRASLKGAGFQLMSRRDLDLCEALNAGYLLRLSILPDVKEMDPNIFREFFPERYDSKGNPIDKEHEPLFDGRVLVFWRGYSEEVTRGRLILPKLDYLQSTLIQKSASWIRDVLAGIESDFMKWAFRRLRRTKKRMRRCVTRVLNSVEIPFLARLLRNMLVEERETYSDALSKQSAQSRLQGTFKLGRYGGSKIKFLVGSADALERFTICEMNYDDPSPCPNELNRQPIGM